MMIIQDSKIEDTKITNKQDSIESDDFPFDPRELLEEVKNDPEWLKKAFGLSPTKTGTDYDMMFWIREHFAYELITDEDKFLSPPYDLTEMLILRKQNKSWRKLAIWYCKEHRSIQRWFDRHLDEFTETLELSIMQFKSDNRTQEMIPIYDLTTILVLRQLDWSWRELGSYFEKDHKSVEQWTNRKIERWKKRRFDWIVGWNGVLTCDLSDVGELISPIDEYNYGPVDDVKKWAIKAWNDPVNYPDFEPSEEEE